MTLTLIGVDALCSLRWVMIGLGRMLAVMRAPLMLTTNIVLSLGAFLLLTRPEKGVGKLPAWSSLSGWRGIAPA